MEKYQVLMLIVNILPSFHAQCAFLTCYIYLISVCCGKDKHFLIKSKQYETEKHHSMML